LGLPVSLAIDVGFKAVHRPGGSPQPAVVDEDEVHDWVDGGADEGLGWGGGAVAAMGQAREEQEGCTKQTKYAADGRHRCRLNSWRRIVHGNIVLCLGAGCLPGRWKPGRLLKSAVRCLH
jgi:hypothetical protein